MLIRKIQDIIMKVKINKLLKDLENKQIITKIGKDGKTVYKMNKFEKDNDVYDEIDLNDESLL